MTRITKSPGYARLSAATLWRAALSTGAAFAADIKVTLSGTNEVPPVTTSASGGGTIMVSNEGSVTGGVTTVSYTHLDVYKRQHVARCLAAICSGVQASEQLFSLSLSKLPWPGMSLPSVVPVT